MVITRKITPAERLQHTGLSYFRNMIFVTVDGYRIGFLVVGGLAETARAIQAEFPGAVCDNDMVVQHLTGHEILFADIPADEFDTDVTAVAPDYTK